MKKYDSGESLNKKVLNGVDKLVDNIAATLGPKGQNVILHGAGFVPMVTKDGATVAKFIDFEDPFENAAAQIIKMASEKTNTEAGDGTTTSAVLARAILIHAQRHVAAGASPVELKRGIDKATKECVKRLFELSHKIKKRDDIVAIATIAANGDKQIGKLIANAIEQAGKDGAITIEEARSHETSLEVLEGFQLESGYLAPQFVTDQRTMTMKHRDAFVLVTEETISSIQQIMSTLQIVERAKRPLILVADGFEGEALAALILNNTRGTMPIGCIKAPRYGEERENIMRDLSISVGATFITKMGDAKLESIKLEHLGRVKMIEAKKNISTFVGGSGELDSIEEKIDSLKAELQQTEDAYECGKLQERIGMLASGVAVIRVGGLTEVEMVERKHRIEDALEAVRSARQEGIVSGGGVALIHVATDLQVETNNSDQALGVQIVQDAVFEPLRKMASNAGKKPDVICEAILSNGCENWGYNFAIDEYGDLVEAGVIDPVKVTRCALQNAVSAAGTLLTTNHCIVEVESA